ncbi:MAG: multicopper oxidase domain-containing protein [Pseudomonadota bacterium]|nr:MAG: multicopper oxidase domain-containing protein [Pseudomonadota bacterium]
MGMGACYVYPIRQAEVPALDPDPDVVYRRGIDMTIPMTMDDGRTVNMWGFTDLGAGGGGMGGMGGMGGSGTFPSPAMRVRQGQVVQTQLQVDMMMFHTIHHHGIEPEYRSDGVGHISWDVNGMYTYQWRPMSAGTYFYHCHTNTVLHAEMGMYGALIVDPPDGPGRAFEGGPSYDLEAIWAVDEIDSSWHGLSWEAGTCGGDVGLNELNPDYFIITGVDGAQSALSHPGVAVSMNVGQRLLVRYICAGYLPQQIRFGGLEAEVVASDGRPLPRSFRATQLDAVSAERYDCIIRPTRSGVHTVEIDIKHWITGEVLGTARTRITVN